MNALDRAGYQGWAISEQPAGQAADVQTARDLARGATQAYGAAKRLLHHSFAESLETQMELEAQAIAAQARGADAREGIAAFIAKRSPKFGGGA